MAKENDIRAFILADNELRGQLVFLSDQWQQLVSLSNYIPQIEQLLGEAVAATCAIGAALKFNAALTLQIESAAGSEFLIAQLRTDGSFRATVKFQNDESQLKTLANLLAEDARLSVALDIKESKQQYRGYAPIIGNSLSLSLEHYFATSEQLPTKIWLAANENAVGGLLLQSLPRDNSKQNGKLADNKWELATTLANTITKDELLSLPAEKILYRLFHELKVRVFEPYSLRFACNCSAAKIKQMIVGLGQKDALDLAKELGQIVVDCEFCKRAYQFDVMAVAQLFSHQSSSKKH